MVLVKKLTSASVGNSVAKPFSVLYWFGFKIENKLKIFPGFNARNAVFDWWFT